MFRTIVIFLATTICYCYFVYYFIPVKVVNNLVSEKEVLIKLLLFLFFIGLFF